MDIGEDNAIVSAIQQEAVLSLIFGVVLAIVALALLLVVRNSFGQIVRDLTSRRRRGTTQVRVLRRLARAVLLTGFAFIATVFAGTRLLDSGTWLAALDPHAAWLIEADGVTGGPAGTDTD